MQTAKQGSSRVISQFIWNILHGKPLKIVDGGKQRRCFTYVSDGIDCLIKIIGKKGNKHIGDIFNIGNPNADKSIMELAKTLIKVYKSHPLKPVGISEPKIELVNQERYYGKGYQDIARRKPSIDKAKRILGWKPKVNFQSAVKKTLDCHLKNLKK